jgi:creatinine amidohydrolase/Fe(II)-dependent formamide hydrolase-like protein
MYGFALRHLPFVRADFDRLRADDYPIRLWTVPVFLFGVLPMMRERKLSRVLVGDEWDTTQKEEFEGIEHYNGYFDQSRFFDEAFTRFTHKKGWDVVQCSLLRPLSELLIEDVLSARYPELFATQVSCHAARVEGERVLPCGGCEKCRRIVGMLVALGRDPGQIGYGPDAVQRCLHSLAEKGVKQEEDGRHLAALLVDAGHVPRGSVYAATAQRQAGTTRLRFDALRSPVNAVPTDLRAPVWRILLEHADGALQLVGHSWVAADPLHTDWAVQPHPFEHAGVEVPEERWPEGHPVHRLAELTWPQARRRFREVDVALLPVGAIEQHGPHLPLDIDSWDAAYQCEQVALACTEPRPLVLPGIPYGVSYHHEDFPGTLSVSPDTLAQMVYEVGMSAARNGIRKLVIVNGHGGNQAALSFAAQKINRDAHIFTAVDTGETSDAEISALLETGGDAHAGEYETSTALATRPHLVFLEHATREDPRFDSRFLDFDSDVSLEWFVRTARISDSGVLGDPTLATAEKGHRIWKITIDNLVELVEHLKGTPLSDLHRPHAGRDV